MNNGKYDADTFPLLVEGYAREGLSNIQIAEKLGIKEACLYKWLKKYVEFREALKRGKAPVDTSVENALLKRALGYEYEEKTTEVKVVPEGGTVTFIRTVTKTVPPDVGAIAFWLKNRKPEQWKDRHETDITSKGEKVTVILPRDDD